MATPRPLGAISLQEQTGKYRIPPLVPMVAAGGSNRVYTFGPGTNATRPAAYRVRDTVAPAVSEPPPP